MYEGFKYRYEAERAYTLAYALGAVRVLPGPGSLVFGTPAQAQPTPEALMNSMASVCDNFLGHAWHVVFVGRRPGLFPSW